MTVEYKVHPSSKISPEELEQYGKDGWILAVICSIQMIFYRLRP